MELISRYLKREKFDSYEDFYNNFQIDIPENFNFGFDIVDEWAKVDPDRRALVWCNDEGEEKTFTFAEMKKYSDKAANFFKAQGIKKGDYVMAILKRNYEYWITAVALHKIGAVLVPATAQLKTKDLIYRVKAANVKLVVCTNSESLVTSMEEAEKVCPQLIGKVLVRGEKEGWISFAKGLEEASEDFVRPTGKEATCNSDPMITYFTSGTSGYPKMAQHCYTYPLGHIITAKYWQNVVPGGLHLTVAETGWAKASWGKLYGQWICGAVIFVYDYSDRFEPADLLQKIQQYKIATFCAPATIFRFLIKEDLSAYDLSSLKHCCIAGEPLNPEVFKQFKNETGHQLMEGFGQSESVVMLANYPWFEPRPGSMGKPSPGYEIHLLNDDEEECGEGETGQIAIKTSERMPYGLFTGYYLDEEKTESVWHDGYYFTGDLAWKDEDGFYWYEGRADDMIKSSGYRIGPFEVESALMEHPAVLETAITAVPDEIRGQVVKATIVLAKGYTPSEELKKELQNHVKVSTAPYKYPRIVEFVDELPKTASGKIKRVDLRERDRKKMK